MDLERGENGKSEEEEERENVVLEASSGLIYMKSVSQFTLIIRAPM